MSLFYFEIPDASVDPELHYIVIYNMVHGICSSINSQSPYMQDGHCSMYMAISLQSIALAIDNQELLDKASYTYSSAVLPCKDSK